jgi:4-carboxymuconolactone decarboxylase
MKKLALAALWIASAALAQAPTGEGLRISRASTTPATVGPTDNFTGRVTVEGAFRAEGPGRAGGASVNFEPGARSAWHTHPLGQTLIVTEGTGLVQRWGAPIQEIRKGDIVSIPPGEKHWHGATPSTRMTHIAIAEQLDGSSVTWLEKVSDAQYLASTPAAPPTTGPTRAQSLFGDVNPKLAQLTDDVLFGDVWARPGLAQRDRSLVTVSALVAMNRPDQLRSHLQRARDNGVSDAELVEAITHLAFYAGWPSAITASVVAREVFQKK